MSLRLERVASHSPFPRHDDYYYYSLRVGARIYFGVARLR